MTTGGHVIDTTEDGAAGSRETEGVPRVVRTLLQSRTALFGCDSTIHSSCTSADNCDASIKIKRLLI